MHMAPIIQHFRKFFVNCWHINNEENMNMWDAYCSNSESVAIRTTLAQFLEGVPNEITNTHQLAFGHIEYMTPEQVREQEIWMGNMFWRFYIKPTAYRAEQEFRFAVWNHGSDVPQGVHATEGSLSIEFNSYSDLVRSMPKVVFHPRSANWFKKLVKDISDTHLPDSKFVFEDSAIAVRRRS